MIYGGYYGPPYGYRPYYVPPPPPPIYGPVLYPRPIVYGPRPPLFGPPLMGPHFHHHHPHGCNIF